MRWCSQEQVSSLQRRTCLHCIPEFAPLMNLQGCRPTCIGLLSFCIKPTAQGSLRCLKSKIIRTNISVNEREANCLNSHSSFNAEYIQSLIRLGLLMQLV